MWKERERQTSSVIAAELVILQVSAKEDIPVNLFRNNVAQEYLKSHIIDDHCRITELHRFCVSNPQDQDQNYQVNQGHLTVLLHIHQMVEGFSYNSSPLVSIFQE